MNQKVSPRGASENTPRQRQILQCFQTCRHGVGTGRMDVYGGFRVDTVYGEGDEDTDHTYRCQSTTRNKGRKRESE